jgi:hypothetical protein
MEMESSLRKIDSSDFHTELFESIHTTRHSPFMYASPVNVIVHTNDYGNVINLISLPVMTVGTNLSPG